MNYNKGQHQGKGRLCHWARQLAGSWSVAGLQQLLRWTPPPPPLTLLAHILSCQQQQINNNKLLFVCFCSTITSSENLFNLFWGHLSPIRLIMWGFSCRLFVFVTLKLKWLRPASWSRGSSLVTTQGQWFSNFFVFSSVEPTYWGKPTRDIMIELELRASGVKIKGVSSWVRPAWVQFTDHTDIGHIFDTAENGKNCEHYNALKENNFESNQDI